jgi:hypothetical protein
MKHLILFCLTLFIFSCGNKKVIQLPEINHSNITDLKDISAAYLFYDETKADSVELNRKNLIVSTNWVVNVDKRLTLKQIIPHIKFLQNKKLNSSHKNEKAKNYFTCNNITNKNLGFIEFTDVVYTDKKNIINYSKASDLKSLKNQITISFNSSNIARVFNPNSETFSIKIDKDQVLKSLKNIDFPENIIYFDFNSDLLFQDYITYKSIISKANLKQAKTSNQEFIYN